MGLVQINPDGTPGDTLEIPDTPWEEPTIEASHGGRRREYDQHEREPGSLRASEHAVLSPMGYFIHGITTDYSLTLLRKDAPPLRIQKVYTPVPVTAGERAEEEAQAIRNMRGTDPNWRWNGPAHPQHANLLSAYSTRERTGRSGSRFTSRGRRWRILSSTLPTPTPSPRNGGSRSSSTFSTEDGSYLGAVRGPDGLSRNPHPIFTREWVLGVVRDEFDVQTVVKFRVELPGERTAPEGKN